MRFVRRLGDVVDTAIVPQKYEVLSERCAAFSIRHTSLQRIGKSSDGRSMNSRNDPVPGMVTRPGRKTGFLD